MKFGFVCCALLPAAFMAAAEGRLFHFPLTAQSYDRRSLAKASAEDDTDLDKLYQARGIQYAMLKVGCPPQVQSGVISTASHAIGIPCSGCTDNCGEHAHLDEFYQEQDSTCFKEIKCGNCTLQSSTSCSTGGKCPVHMSYAEGSEWSGREVEDEISVGGEDRGEKRFPLRFACQTDVDGLFEGQIPDGIFGMNKQKGSAIKQWTEKGFLDDSAFSLCYNIREDLEKKSGVMVLGGANPRLREGPMMYAKDVGEDGNYEVRIKQIRLQSGAISATANADIINLGLSGTDTAILDSGTTCTYLNRKWQEPLEQAWKQLTEDKYAIFRHLAISKHELGHLPTILFDLVGTEDNKNITVSYPPIRYLEKSPSGGYDFCMYPEDIGSGATLGNTFMSGHDVHHDLDNRRIGFAESTCNITKIGTSVETDGTKTVALQSEPHQKRDPTSPGFKFLYVLIAFIVVGVVGVSFYRRNQRKALSSNSTTLDGEGDFQTQPNVEMT